MLLQASPVSGGLQMMQRLHRRLLHSRPTCAARCALPLHAAPGAVQPTWGPIPAASRMQQHQHQHSQLRQLVRAASSASAAPAASSPQAGNQAGGQAPAVEVVFLLGFPPEELQLLQEHQEEIFGDLAPAQVLPITASLARKHTVGELLQLISQQGQQGSGAPGPLKHLGDAGCTEVSEAEVCEARVVYLVGPSAQQLATAMNDALVQAGIAPAVVAARTPKHDSMTLEAAVHGVRAAHARFWDLVRPVALHPELPLPAARTHSSAQGGSQPQQQQALHPVLQPLTDARVVLSAAMDAGEVPNPYGGWRRDEAHLVVLDGLITEQERASLLAWLTAPDHDHSGPPPEDKWEMSCVDREGDNATWGLRPEMLASLEQDPPPELVALQSRLAALWPEYRIAHMPADVLAPPEDAEAGTSLSCFVGNAVMQGDPCAYHDDADPAVLPPTSPWVHCYGYYYNREPRRPRFVTVLLYLNESWPDELHAETLFLDPASQAGVFVRPAPGRVALMDQDMSHRISAPSAAAAGSPRYSLVWKLIWFPADDPTLPAELQASSPQAQTVQGQGQGGASAQKGPVGPQPVRVGLCRPEWGEPMRFGSAGQLLGKPVLG